MANILFVNKLSPMAQGGAETRIREVSRRLAASGHRVYVLCGRTSADEPASEVIDGVYIRYVSVLPSFVLRRLRPGHYLPMSMFYLVSGPAILRAVRRWDIDVIRDSISPLPGLGVLTPFLSRQAMGVTHILYRTLSSWRRYYGLAYGLAGYVFETALVRGWLPYRAVVTDSNWLAKDLAARLSKRVRSRPILNGIDCSQFLPRSRHDASVLRILSVARFTEHKRQAVLLDACTELQRLGIPFEVSFVGDGPLRESLQTKANASPACGGVRFLGALTATQMSRVYSEHDVLAVTSTSEGLPVAVLEAMASRLPVVAPETPYITEMTSGISDMLVTYATGEPEALALAIQKVWREGAEVRRREENAWEWVRRLAWDDVAAAEWEEMSQILDDRNSRVRRSRE